MRSIILASVILAGTASAQSIDNFDSGTNPNGWAWNGFSTTVVEATGGNPGGWLHAANIQFANFPILSSGATAASPFVGDYRAKGVTDFKFDAQGMLGPGGFNPMTLVLIDDKSTSSEADDDYAFYVDVANLSPTTGAGWISYSFAVPSADTSALPTGWLAGSNFSWGNGFSAGYDWNNLVQNVTTVEIWFGDPQSFGFGQNWDMGVDNIEIVMPAPTFTLAMPNPGPPGGTTTLETVNATPNGVVYMGYSLNLGSSLAPCGGSTVTTGLQNGTLAGAPIASGTGEASLLVAVPAAAAGRTVHIQALDNTTCTLSNVLTHTF